MLTIEEIKEEVSLQDVLLEVGADFNTSWSQTEIPFFCPFHHNVNTPAASLNQVKQVFNCYSCGASGSVIDAALIHLGPGTTVKQAVEWLEEVFIT